jgi:hypothetical protein
MDSEPPTEPTGLLCSAIRKLYTHEEIKNGVAFDNRMNKIKGMKSRRHHRRLIFLYYYL